MQHQLFAFVGILFAVSISCSSLSVQKDGDLSEQAVSGIDTCDGPDSNINCCFVNMPYNLSEVMVIADEKEAGARIVITGQVFKNDGKTPLKDVIIYAYHTDNTGIYSKSGKEAGFQKWHGKLHGWCITNSEGRYEIHTIRPASYPNSTAPAHIHAVVKLPGGIKPFYIKDFVFDDDPFVDEKIRSGQQFGEGQAGVLKLEKQNGVWRGVRDLLMNIN